MKIAILHPRITTKGGAVRMMLLLGRTLQKKHSVDFFTFQHQYDCYSILTKDLRIHAYETSWYTKIISMFSLAKRIADFDVIWVGNSPMHFVAIFSKLFFGSKAKIVWWHHHRPWYFFGNVTFFAKCKGFIEKLLTKYIDVFVANSEITQDDIEQIYKRKAQILYPCIDPNVLEKKVESKKYNNPPILCHYGRLTEEKNTKFLLETFEFLQNKFPGVTLQIGGTGPLSAEVQKWSQQYKGIDFLWELDTSGVADILNSSDVFLDVSLIDAFGMAKMEAALFGLKVFSLEKYSTRQDFFDALASNMQDFSPPKKTSNSFSYRGFQLRVNQVMKLLWE